jgi:hypothetical protein
MAGKEMVTAKARTKIGTLLRQMEKAKGQLRLAMLVQSSPDLPGRWSLVVSAPWMDSLGPRAVINDLTKRLLRSLDKNTLSVIDGVSVLSSSDPLVETIVGLLNDFLGVNVAREDGGFYVNDSQIEDWNIPQAFVFIANSRLNGKQGRSTSPIHKLVAS